MRLPLLELEMDKKSCRLLLPFSTIAGTAEVAWILGAIAGIIALDDENSTVASLFFHLLLRLTL